MNKPQAFRAIVDRNVPCTLRDGTTLYADIWRPDCPDGEERCWPVLLTRLPYNKAEPRIAPQCSFDTLRAVGEGYVVIYQDTRGRFTSEGISALDCDDDDGYDAVEWAAALPYSDGNVGMFGISYLGLTQWLAAAARPPHLKAIFPQQMGSGFESFMFSGGAFNLGSGLFWAGMQAGDVLARRAAAGEDIADKLAELMALIDGLPEAYRRLPLAGSHSVISDASPFYDEWLRRAEEAAYWPQFEFGHRLADIDIPIFHLGSWNDIYGGDSPALFAQMREAAGAASGAQKLIMGPWVHGQMDSATIGELYMGVSATGAGIDLPGLQLRWFDHWLKGKDTGLMNDAPVRLYVMGDNSWRDEQEWPLARTVWTDYYLHSNGAANTREGDGSLSSAVPSGKEAPDTFVYDPANPVPSVGGAQLMPVDAGPRNQARVESRADVLVYSTPPLEQDVEVTGPVTAALYAATSAPDTDWTVRLVDVHPDGESYGVVDGIVRARYRNGRDKPALLEPGEVYEYRIDLTATSRVFKRGHRIRIQVSSSNFPRFARNHNTGAGIATDTELVPATQTVMHDPQYPSRIRLPIIPR
jgi:putative CocE/NonD family hydrolase